MRTAKGLDKKDWGNNSCITPRRQHSPAWGLEPILLKSLFPPLLPTSASIDEERARQGNTSDELREVWRQRPRPPKPSCTSFKARVALILVA